MKSYKTLFVLLPTIIFVLISCQETPTQSKRTNFKHSPRSFHITKLDISLKPPNRTSEQHLRRKFIQKISETAEFSMETRAEQRTFSAILQATWKKLENNRFALTLDAIIIETGAQNMPQKFRASWTHTSNTDNKEKALRELSELGVDPLIDQLRLAARAYLLTDKEILKDLSSSDNPTLLLAIRQVSLRKLDKALPALRSLLTHPDQEILLATVGVLQTFRDPESPALLISLFKQGDPILSRAILFALADIGGSEAENFLRWIMLKHPDPTFRDIA